MTNKILARNSLLNFIGQIVPLVVALGLTPLIVTTLGADRFGLLSLALVVLGYFSVLDLGLGTSVTKHISEILSRGDMHSLPSIVQTALVIQILFGLFLGSVLFYLTPLLAGHILALSPSLVGEAEGVFYVIAASVPVILASTSLQGILVATQNFGTLNAISIVANIFVQLLALSGALLEWPISRIVALLLVPRIFALLAYAAFVLRVFPYLMGKCVMTLSAARSLLSFGGWVMVTNLVWPILVYIDHFLIASLQSTTILTYYAVPHKMVSLMDRVSGSVVSALFPSLSVLGVSRITQTERLCSATVQLVIILVGPLLIGFVVFAEPILTLLLRTEFNEVAVMPLRIMAVGALGTSLLHIPFTVLYAFGRPGFIGKFYLGQLVTYPVFLYFVIIKFGLIGAAIAWTCRVLLLLTILLVACYGYFRVSPLGERSTVRVILGLGLLLTIGSFLTAALGNRLALEGVVFFLSIVLFAVLIWANFSNHGNIAYRLGLPQCLSFWNRVSKP